MTPIPEEQGPQIVVNRSGDFTTPVGNVVRNYGWMTGEQCIRSKEHSPETIDDIIANPTFSLPSSRRDNATGATTTLVCGRDGIWVLLNDRNEMVIQINDLQNPWQEPPY